jgi:DNA-binding SARP family transcriptional activator/tetratricopeptide (TPR) repeat protein
MTADRMVGTVRVRLLGPVDLVLDGVLRKVDGTRRKAVLAVLGLQPGEFVSTHRLVHLVWGERPPATAVKSLRNHVSYLRSAFGERPGIAAVAGGFVLELTPEETDVGVAEALIRSGGRTGDAAGSMVRLSRALGLWRGTALSDVTGVDWLDQQADRLEQLRIDGVEALLEARLAAGGDRQLVPELEQLIVLHPFREQLHRLLMVALYRCGRQVEALALYQRIRHRLSDELGIDPTPALRDLEASILRQDASLVSPSAAVAAQTVPPSEQFATAVVPAQLPAIIPAFTAREAELADLDATLGHAPGGIAHQATPVAAVSGIAGIGKTALVVQWAHRNSTRFPDGQLYVNLRGYDHGGAPARPADVIPHFLAALGVPPEQRPSQFDAQIGLYRSLLAGKRLLVVLDNARDARQVRPLLPGAPGCMAVVTSRDQLVSLVANEGAHPIVVSALSATDARELLDRRLGSGRAMAEPDAVAEIVACCVGLPLALAIVAARAATQPQLSIAAVASDLRRATNTLDGLHGGDPTTDMRAVFFWSYRTLSAMAARMLRLCAVHPGPDISVAALPSLIGLEPAAIRPLMSELVQANLVIESAAGRYTLHDLLRAYASEQADRYDRDDRDAILHRILDHYLRTGYVAALRLSPFRYPIDLLPPQPGVTPESVDHHDAGLAWFVAEHPILLAVIDRAIRAGLDAHAWQLGWTMSTFLIRRGHWTEQVTLQQVALAAARRLDDHTGEAHTLCALGTGYFELGRLDDAESCYRQEEQLFAIVGDRTGQARALVGLANVAARRGELLSATSLATRALELYRAIDDQAGQANVLTGIGWFHTLLGDHRCALTYTQRALPLLQNSGYREVEAKAWDGLGHAHRGLGEYAQAISSYQTAIDLYRQLGDRHDEAASLASLGDTHDVADDHDAADTAWRQALTIMDDLQHPDGDHIRTRIIEASTATASRSRCP